MNVWLGDARAATPAVLQLLDFAATDMTAWVEELASTGASQRNSDALVAAAARGAGRRRICTRCRAGRSGGAGRARARHRDGCGRAARAGRAGCGRCAGSGAGRGAGSAVEEQPFDLSFDMQAPFDPDLVESAAAGATLNSRSTNRRRCANRARSRAGTRHRPRHRLPRRRAGSAPPPDNIRRFGDLEIPLPLYNIYLAETDELMRVLTQDFGEWRHEPLRAVSPAALKAAHTLAGTSATVGFKALRGIAYALEMALLALVEPAPVLLDEQRDLLDETVATCRPHAAPVRPGRAGPAPAGAGGAPGGAARNAVGTSAGARRSLRLEDITGRGRSPDETLRRRRLGRTGTGRAAAPRSRRQSAGP